MDLSSLACTLFKCLYPSSHLQLDVIYDNFMTCTMLSKSIITQGVFCLFHIMCCTLGALSSCPWSYMGLNDSLRLLCLFWSASLDSLLEHLPFCSALFLCLFTKQEGRTEKIETERGCSHMWKGASRVWLCSCMRLLTL